MMLTTRTSNDDLDNVHHTAYKKFRAVEKYANNANQNGLLLMDW